MSLFDELKRRKVFRVAAVYTATAFVVLQAVDLLVEALGVPDGVLTAVAIVSIIGFPVAIVLAWVFDVTPDQADPEQTTGGEVVLPRRTAVLVAVLLLAGVGVGWVLKPGASGSSAGTPDGSPSIAVLPFVNASADPNNEFFSHGVAEDLIIALGRLPGLDVKARTSTWQFAGSNVSAQQVADSIGATTVLAGRVQRSGDNVRISVELVRGSNGDVLWTDRFEGTVDDLFQTQTRIAEAIVGTLQIRLAADDRAPVEVSSGNSEAYDHFLRGRYNLALRNVPAIEDAIRDFDAAVAADSSFALAWAGLAEAWMLAGAYSVPAPASEMWANSNAALTRAIELDPTLPQPHAVRGYFLYRVGRWEDAEAPLLRALELDPEYTDAMQWLAEVYSRLGRMDEAVSLVERALDREPYARGITSAAVEVYDVIDLEESIGYVLRLLELGQTESALQELWYRLLYLDRFDEAFARATEWVDALGLPANQVGGALTGLQSTFDAIENYRATGQPGSVHPALVNSPMSTLSLQVMVGRPELGIAKIEDALFRDHVNSMGILQRPAFWEIRDDPRIGALRERMRLKFSDDRP